VNYLHLVLRTKSCSENEKKCITIISIFPEFGEKRSIPTEPYMGVMNTVP